MTINDSLHEYPYELICIAKIILSTIPVQIIKEKYPDINQAEYPAEIILKDYIHTSDCFDGYINGNTQKEGVFFEFYKEAINHSILCHHYTRVLSPKQIRLNGLQPNNWNNYSLNMKGVLQELNIDKKLIDKAITVLNKHYKFKYTPAPNDINYTTVIDDFYIKNYTSNIGGELAYCLEDFDNDLWLLLKSKGVPVRVEFSININEDSNPGKLVHYLLTRILTRLIWHTDEKSACYNGITKKTIESVRSVEIVEL